MASLYAEVVSDPKAKGSVSGFPITRKGGKVGVSIVHSKGSKRFEKIIREAIETAPFIPGAVVVELWFYVLRPKSVKRTYPSVPGDLDKFVRAAFDAVNKTKKSPGHWEDDGRVVDLHAFKRYATESIPPGVWIYIRSKDDAELSEEVILNTLVRQVRLASHDSEVRECPDHVT